MTRNITLIVFISLLFSISNFAQTNSGSEIISYERFGEGLMVTKAKMVPISGIVSNIFFYNRDDQPWNGNVWYEYDFEMRGRYPSNGWAQIRVRPENGGQLKDAPVNIGVNEEVGSTLFNYILIRKGNFYVYDIRKEFDINTYNYANAGSHGGNSESLVTGGPRTYTTGGNVADIPTSKRLDFSLGVTAFDNGWAGSLPPNDYEGEFVVDYTRFYPYNENNLSTNPSWSDEFNGNQIDYGKWQIANWSFGKTQFTQNNIRLEDGLLFLKINRDQNSDGNVGPDNIALNGIASQSSTRHGGLAQRAIDNNTNGNWNQGSITHTANGNNVWWRVDFDKTEEIDRIVLHNRTNCCMDRLSNFSVSVLDANDRVVWTKYYTDFPSPSLTINLDTEG